MAIATARSWIELPSDADMPRRRSPIGFSPSLRVFISCMLTAVTLALALVVTIGGVARQAAPAVAIRFGGSDAQALANVAQTIARNVGDRGARQEAQRMARLALRKDGTIADAYGVLGVISSAQGHVGLANLQFSHAAEFSKRKLDTELWLAQRRMAESDRDAAILHLDRAMKVHPRSWPLTLPILVGALDDHLFIEPITNRLAKEPSWSTAFLAMSATQTKSPSNLSAVFDQLKQRQVPVSTKIVSHFAVRLAREGQFDLAAHQYKRAMGFIPNGLNNGGFEKASVIEPFDWNFSHQPEYVAEATVGPDGAKNGRALQFRFGTGAPRVLLRQLMMLHEGRYVLAGRVYLEELDRVTAPTWEIVCAERDEKPAKIKIRGEIGRWTEFRQQIEVSEHCRGQWIQLVRPSAVVEGSASGYFDDLVLAGN